jgi:hypothetical protein
LASASVAARESRPSLCWCTSTSGWSSCSPAWSPSP